jgi:hypothetical protein
VVDEDGLPSSPEEWRRFFAQLHAAAARVMRRRNVWELIRQGAPMIGITREDLVQHALQCLFANKPPFFIAVESPCHRPEGSTRRSCKSRARNLLYPVEKTRLQNLLRGPEADKFVRAAAAFANETSANSLRDMESTLKPHENAKWTVVTYLPYLWRPDHHMFLKPEVTKDFAARVGHPFASQYEARLDFSVYRSLLDLVRKTEEALTPLKPRDRIDIQSFIWIVGDYREGREGVYQ